MNETNTSEHRLPLLHIEVTGKLENKGIKRLTIKVNKVNCKKNKMLAASFTLIINNIYNAGHVVISDNIITNHYILCLN